MKLNRKGFTLIELLAAIVLFAIIASIGAYSITGIIKTSKNKDYELFVKNIKDAAEVFYQECKYARTDNISCRDFVTLNGVTEQIYAITFSKMIEYGYLTGNSKITEGDNKNNYTIVNPLDNVNVGDCYIYIYYSNGEYIIKDKSPTRLRKSCPTEDNYNGIFGN